MASFAIEVPGEANPLTEDLLVSEQPLRPILIKSRPAQNNCSHGKSRKATTFTFNLLTLTDAFLLRSDTLLSFNSRTASTTTGEKLQQSELLRFVSSSPPPFA
jgi:hypothetical protein